MAITIDQTVAKQTFDNDDGASGSCPASGLAGEAYSAGHSRSTYNHAMAAIANLMGPSGASTALAAMEAIEIAAGISETTWAGSPFRFRAP